MTLFDNDNKVHTLYGDFLAIVLEKEYRMFPKNSVHQLKVLYKKYETAIPNQLIMRQIKEEIVYLEYLDHFELVKLLQSRDGYQAFIDKYENSQFKDDYRIKVVLGLLDEAKLTKFKQAYKLARVSASQSAYTKFLEDFKDNQDQLEYKEILILKEILKKNYTVNKFHHEDKSLETARENVITQLNDFLKKPENAAIQIIDLEHSWQKIDDLDRFLYTVVVTFQKL